MLLLIFEQVLCSIAHLFCSSKSMYSRLG
uniref:Uncharacterized protein n=1 Tax=Arundo donax TaxID=35708 RepID=A0A0A9SLU4_ARUDO